MEMSNSTAQVLMKKGKRGAAAYIHADCTSGFPQYLGPLLDVLLNPSKAIDEWETLDWCRWLLAGGRTPDDFATVVRSYDKHDKCGLVWIPRVVAYRCRTCGISPCMSICRECFHRGDHSTHDFNMFLSQAGGACDCGDKSVMKEDGFCSEHGNKCPRPGSIPSELMCVAEAMMPRLILRLLQHFRENSWEEANSETYRVAVQDCEGYVQMLMEINNMGDLMRAAMTKALINPQMYRNLVGPPYQTDTEYGCYMVKSQKMYHKAKERFPAPEPPNEYRFLLPLSPTLEHETLLEELIFWTFRYEFPQNVVCFLLNMLPDQDYKEHLTRTFVMHYARIPLVLETAADPDTLSNRVVHMSVQLFSNEALALKCVQQLHLLHVMVLSLKLMMGKILVQSTLHDPEKNFHYVIDCTRRVMKEHCYWPLVSDFNNVLSHKSVALLFLQDASLVHMWFEFLSMLQGMNVNVRETGLHIEFEPSSYYAAFSCELEAAAYPMWSVLAHLAEPQQSGTNALLAAGIIAKALRALADWLDSTGAHQHSLQRSSDVASFHFPLHRYLAAFLCCATRSLGIEARSVLPPAPALAALARHPLAVQSFFYEILGGIWVRNGLQIKGQAMTYIQANFCNSMVDMDIYFLQICAAHLPPDHFVEMCIDAFNVREWLSMSPLTAKAAAEQDSMVEGLLTFLAIIVSQRTNLGNDEVVQSRLEVSTLLAAADRTHSQLLELMPERGGNAHTRNFESVLKELSTYRPPPKGSENLEQGLFVPNPIVWQQYYDPLHVLRRAVHRKDFHASMERFTAYVRDKQKSEGSESTDVPGASTSAESGAARSLWPPLRPAEAPPPAAGDPRQIVNSGVLQGALLGVLARAAGRGADGEAPPGELALALAVYLLRVATRLAADKPPEHNEMACIARCDNEWSGGSSSRSRSSCPRPPSLFRVFGGGDICDNARTHVASVSPHASTSAEQTDPAHVYPAQYYSDSDMEWEIFDSDGAVKGPSLATSTALAVPEQREMVRNDSLPDDQSDSGGDVTTLPALESGESQALAIPSYSDTDIDTEPNTPLAISDVTPTLQYVFNTENVEAWPTTVLPESPEDQPGPSNLSTELQLHADQSSRTISVQESIISLLLKLHSQLSGRLDSFSLDDDYVQREEPIGDGPHFIGEVLHSLAKLDIKCASAIDQVRHSLWPHQREREAEMKARERREKDERSRRARERQQQVMRDFQRRQQQFLNAMEQEGVDADLAADLETDHETDAEAEAEREYLCVICSTTAHTDPNDPIGLVVLLQSTSVAGHRRRIDPENVDAEEAADSRIPRNVRNPTDDVSDADDYDDAPEVPRHEDTLASHMYTLHDLLQSHFDQDSCVLSINIAWESGVHVASCGHHLHLRCLQSYIKSLQASQRPHNLQVERGEYLCPMCRQLANSVLPLAQRPRRPAPTVPTPPNDDEAILQMLMNPPPAVTTSKLSEAMGKAMEDMLSTSSILGLRRYGSTPAALLCYTSSILRTNLECEIIQRGSHLVSTESVASSSGGAARYRSRGDTLAPLFAVTATAARALLPANHAQISMMMSDTWRQLSGAGGAASSAEAVSETSGALVVSEAAKAPAVPLLLRDPTAVLLLFLLLLPEITLDQFTCLVRRIWRACLYQAVGAALAGGSAELRAAVQASTEQHELVLIARELLAALRGSDLFAEDGPEPEAEAAETAGVATKLETLCCPPLLAFLRCVALYRENVLGGGSVPKGGAELPALRRYLQVDGGLEAGAEPTRWARALAMAAGGAALGVRRALQMCGFAWTGPRLLRLPFAFERLFSRYHERACLGCGGVPKEASLCLVCGTLVCLKTACCRRGAAAEASRHAAICGGGTGIFLVVTSTYTIVIRGRRAALWGSLYLDEYDEEDRDLKRGKPLYLSRDRLELLQAQWLAHRFDHTKRTWVWHRDSL